MNGLRPVLRLRLEINAKRAIGHMEPHQIVAVRALRPHHADQAAKGERCSSGNLGDFITPLFSRLNECVAAPLHVDLYSERRLPRFDGEAALYVGNRKRGTGYGIIRERSSAKRRCTA